jgi:FkbM family methyltransferase
MSLAERQKVRHIWRQKKQDNQDNAILPNVQSPIDTVIQIGIGHWMEGQSLLKHFQNAKFIGIEPVARYCKAAIDAGFRGNIHTGFAWSESGIVKYFTDRMEKTSVFVNRTSKSIESTSITIDDLVSGVELGNVFLWIDCERSEIEALKGAVKTLESTTYILTEWSYGKNLLNDLGFIEVFRFHKMLLFKRK